MKNKRINMLMLLFFLLVTTAYSQMNEESIVDVIKREGVSGGKMKEIGEVLRLNGVEEGQLDRLKLEYERGGGSKDSVRRGGVDASEGERFHRVDEGVTVERLNNEGGVEGKVLRDDQSSAAVFGRDIFTSKDLTFEPNENMATPENYRLGPGDEVIIDIWGTNEASIRQFISPEGNIMVSQVGPIYLNGFTIEEAERKVSSLLSGKYSGMKGEEPKSELRVTLGAIRSIQINIMGEVAVPGTYRFSSFSTVFHALYCAGGVSRIGSLRNISVLRGGRTLVKLDVYEYILQGKFRDDIRLEDGDVILVPPYEELVRISGKVKRPMYYEMRNGESLGTLMGYAGGFRGDAYVEEVSLVRCRGREKEFFSIRSEDYGGWVLEDGDSVNVGAILDRFANRVEIRGSVYRPGMYELSEEINSVKKLVERAEGLKGDAFLSRVHLYREKEDMSLEIMAIDLGGIMGGSVEDVMLKREDVLVIPSIHELEEKGFFGIFGEVARPGTYSYAENTTLEDLIVRAGGLLEGASQVRVEVSRRLKDPTSKESTRELSRIYRFSICEGLVMEGASGFVLEPYDYVEIRRSPGYQVQRRVTVSGEVVFPGGYTLFKKNERLSDLIECAGGVTEDAYIRGGRLIRVIDDYELTRRQAVLEMALMSSGKDTIPINKLKISDKYSVAIELDKALANPGSDYDVVLREGDVLVIPEYESTVKISGEVMFPNVVTRLEGKSARYYVRQSGGYTRMAKRGKAYIVKMNGTISRFKSLKSADIEPGCEIIIPSRKVRRRGMSIQEFMALTTSAASVGTMAASIGNLLK